MKVYDPYVFLGKYSIGDRPRDFIEQFIGMQYVMGRTLRTSIFGESNQTAIDTVKRLNQENLKSPDNQLELYIPFDNTKPQKNMYINPRVMDYELQNVNTLIKQSDILDYMTPKYVDSKKLYDFIFKEGDNFEKINGYALKFLPSSQIMKSMCASMMLLGEDSKSVEEVFLYGGDSLRTKTSRINTTIDNKLINLVKLFSIEYNINVFDMDLDTQSIKFYKYEG